MKNSNYVKDLKEAASMIDEVMQTEIRSEGVKELLDDAVTKISAATTVICFRRTNGQTQSVHKEEAKASLSAVVKQFESYSEPGKVYTAELDSEGRAGCDCPGWRYAGKCWHIKALQKHGGEIYEQ